jgi:hypothetical protein
MHGRVGGCWGGGGSQLDYSCTVCDSAHNGVLGACFDISDLLRGHPHRYVLLDNWRTFYPSPLRPDGDGDGEEIQNSDELLVILQALLASFNNAEIEPFKHNLETLVVVNTQKKLFSKIFFREHIYIDLLSSLLGVMVAKTHALLEDEICDTLFELAQSDWSAFYTLALPTVLASIDGVDDAHREELTSRFKQVDDKPSFIERLQEFCSDLAHFQQDAHPLFT